jgi:hypothetical protein
VGLRFAVLLSIFGEFVSEDFVLFGLGAHLVAIGSDPLSQALNFSRFLSVGRAKSGDCGSDRLESALENAELADGSIELISNEQRKSLQVSRELGVRGMSFHEDRTGKIALLRSVNKLSSK